LGGEARDTESLSFTSPSSVSHDVGGLDVAVNDARVVARAQSVAKVGSPGTGARPGNGRFGKHLLQSSTVTLLHHQVGNAGFFDADVEQVDDGGVGELPDDLRLAQNCFCCGAAPKGVNKRFDGYSAANDFVAGFVDATGGAEKPRGPRIRSDLFAWLRANPAARFNIRVIEILKENVCKGNGSRVQVLGGLWYYV